ncbi:GNAT family N-acetyltransferase [Vulgatibacter sp.]|uniref:GNAT family N-acetyltransferase n=1 Tax=Vulgatibacter sp. TaxID=1971226 RepID=UPI003568C117
MIDLVPAISFSLPQLAAIFARSFEGYFVPFPEDPVRVEALIRCEGVHLADSRVALSAGEPVGLVLVSRRDRESRIAAMGIVPAFRGKRVGEEMLRPLLEEARSRADEQVRLEVIDVNHRAVRLYERVGFQRSRHLVGFEGVIDPEAAPLDRASIEEVAALLPVGLPWSCAANTLRNLASPTYAVRLGSAVAIVRVGEAIGLRAIAVEPEGRRQGAALRLLRAIAAAHPGKRWQIPGIVPEGPAAELLRRVGLQPGAFSQWEMSWTP